MQRGPWKRSCPPLSQKEKARRRKRKVEKENGGTKSIGGGVIQAGARDADQKDKQLTSYHLFHLRSLALTLALAFGIRLDIDIGIGCDIGIGIGKCPPKG